MCIRDRWQAGLGDYAYNVKHYKKIATVGEDYSFVYTQVMGLTVEFCKAGGEITKRFWEMCIRDSRTTGGIQRRPRRRSADR